MAVFVTAWLFYASLWILRSCILVNCVGKPKFRGQPETNYTAFLGDSVKLKCPVSGTDGAEHNRTLVAWSKGEEYITNTHSKWNRFLIKNEKHLKIVRVEEEDAGIYVCKAMNLHGNARLVITLKVKPTKKPGRGKPPRFKQPTKTKQTYKTGETAKLQCHSTGDPDPKVEWFKNGKSYGVEKRTSVGPDGWTLNLRYLDQEDSGQYTCRVSNNVGSINRTFTVRVKARIQKPFIEAPDVAKHTERKGRTVKFDCKVTSVGHVTFKWMWSGKKANGSVDLRRSNLFGVKYIENHTKTRVVSMNRFYYDGFLVIKDVRKQDEGKYTCVVADFYGSDKMDFFLNVREKDEQIDSETNQGSSSTVPANTKGNVRRITKTTMPVVLVVVLTTSIVVSMIFVVVLIVCCRKQRKDMEKQYASEYQPHNLIEAYDKQTNAYHEVQKSDHNHHVLLPRENNEESVKTSKEAYGSLPVSQNSIGTQNYLKRFPSSSSEIYLANSRTSLQTTLCRTYPRETSLDYQGNGHYSLPRRTESTNRQHVSGVLSRGSSSPGLSNSDRDTEETTWESRSCLDDSPKNTSPQRSRESIV